MDERLSLMLQHYKLERDVDYINALKEIIQEIALLGLSRTGFFDKAAFYGGTALRILYGLDRYSEDLDFSLLKANKNFSLDEFNAAVKDELTSFGLETTIQTKNKSMDSQIVSAFIKAETRKQLINIEVPEAVSSRLHQYQTLKIKMEVDVDPPGLFQTEVKPLLLPIPFVVRSYQKPDLFAGKIHAILCRQWQNRVKGRDWYDMVWYIAHKIPVRLLHLQERLVQSGHWPEQQLLTHNVLLEKLHQKADLLDIDSAKQDVMPFVKDLDAVKAWSIEFFHHIIDMIQDI